jgi:hypothetical protein
MRNRRLFSLLSLAFLGLLTTSALTAQDSSLKQTFQQAKALWATQGDRDGASLKFEQILSALEPKAKTLDAEWSQVLCETYNWLAVLDDRNPARRPRTSKELEAILDLNPDFDIDRSITNTRLQGIFDGFRNSKLCKVKLVISPEGGTLILDGKPRGLGQVISHYFSPGSHVIAYSKPGYQLSEQHVELSLKESKTLEFSLTRVSSTLSLNTCPSGAEVLLDGKSLGATSGQASSEFQPFADKLGISVEQLSTTFIVSEIGKGKHVLEVKAPCYRLRRIELGDEFSMPLADRVLEPIKLEPSRGILSVQSTAPGGELFLSGKSYGSLPVKDLSVCAGSYDLQIKFPSGGFTQSLEIADGKSVSLQVRPKPRMVYLGFEGNDEFAGRERLLKLLTQFGDRLKDVAFLRLAPGESFQDGLNRLKSSKDAELLLWGRPVPGKPIHQIEMIISTLSSGEEEHLFAKPLEEDPLGVLAAKLNAQAVLSEPWSGLTLLDIKGAAGPWVLQADVAAQKAGVKPFKIITALNGKPVASVQAFRKALRETQSDRMTITQDNANIPLVISSQVLELPVNASNLCYPFLLADLRLRYLGARGDEAGLLRLNQALALMHFRLYDRAMEVLRDTKVSQVQGVSQGTIDYYTGICLLRLGNVYASEAAQAFNQALKYPQATLFGPEGPLVSTLAKQALEDLNP